MKKSVYTICLCLLSVLVFYEVRHTYVEETGSDTVVPTSRFVSHIQQENAKHTDGTKKEQEKKNEKKVAYLTFDDGPSENTKKILKILEEKKAVATFFLIGKEITEEREETVKELKKKGNAIGVHTYCHQKNRMYCNAQCFYEDFQQASEAIEKITGEKPTLHRFPYGSNNSYVKSYVDELHENLQKKGVRSFDWNVSGEDSLSPYVAQETIFQNVKKDLTRYEQPIILLHDAAAMNNTAAVLGRIIDYIREEGYTFDTLENRDEYMVPASWR